MGKIILFHGTSRPFIDPKFGYGNKNNDYGLAFYLTPSSNLAEEWSSQYSNFGYVNKYELKLNGLKILDLTSGGFSILNWIAILLHFRKLGNGFINEFKEELKFISKYYIDVDKYDVIIGYRADDAYFEFPKEFINEGLTLESLDEIFKLGNLGIQYALKSKKSFNAFKFIDSTEANKHKEYHQRMEDAKKRFQDLYKENRLKQGTRLKDLMNHD